MYISYIFMLNIFIVLRTYVRHYGIFVIVGGMMPRRNALELCRTAGLMIIVG